MWVISCRETSWFANVNCQAELDRLGMFPIGPLKNSLLKEITDLQHHLFLLTTNWKLALAPVDPNAQWVLDVGTGTGIW